MARRRGRHPLLGLAEREGYRGIRELPLVDSNHHYRIQSPMSCRWTKGQSPGSIADYDSMISTGATRIAVAVVTALAGVGSSEATAQGGAPSARIAKTVEPEPLIRANWTPFEADKKSIAF